MRYVFGFWFALALSLALMAGCSDENGDGGSGGTAGTGGIGGTGGTDLCAGVVCDAECKTDGVCNPASGTCDYDGLVENGTACSEGECLDGVCAPIGAFPCTEQGIRDAIAEGGGPHFFACDGPTMVLIEAEIVIDNDVILDGEGNLTVDGNEEALLYLENRRVFSVATDIAAELRGFTVSGGSNSREGGGIYNQGTLTLTNSTVSDNVANDGCGIFNTGTLTLTNSTVSDNRGLCWAISNKGTMVLTNSTVSGNMGGIFNNGTATLTSSTVSDNAEAGIFNGGTLTLTNSTVSGNRASVGDGGGIYNSGTLTLTSSTVSDNTGEGIHNAGTLMLTNSTVSDNTGEGIYIYSSNLLELTTVLTNSTVSGNTGTGIDNSARGTLTLTDSTVSGNSLGISNSGSASLLIVTKSTVSGNEVGMIVYGETRVINSTVSANNGEVWGSGGGIWIISGGGELTVINSTVSDNGGDTYASIYVDDSNGPTNITLTNTLVDGDCSVAGESSVTSGGHNIESPGDTCGFDQATDQVEVSADDLKLGELADNGGPTMTHALGAGSVAIDWIPDEDCVDADGQPLTTDQRGEPRPETGGTMCDVGAFEVQP